MAAHWGVHDPAAVHGDEETKQKAFLNEHEQSNRGGGRDP